MMERMPIARYVIADQPVIVAQPTLYIMVGYPGSGKSTYIEKNFRDTEKLYFVVAHDILMSMISGKYNDSIRWLYNEIERHAIITPLLAGIDTIVDRTCLTKTTRRRFIQIANMTSARPVAIVMNTTFKDSFNRNAIRKNPIPPEDMLAMLNKYEAPEYSEGFESIIVANGGAD